MSAPQADNPTQQSYADVICSAAQVVPPDSGNVMENLYDNKQSDYPDRKFNFLWH